MRCTRLFLAGLAAVLMSAAASVSAGDPATAAVEIPLRRSGSPESTTLAAYRGQIVVLDFFA